MGLLLVTGAQAGFLLLEHLQITSEYFILIPILLLGFGHALFTTLQGSLVNKHTLNQLQIPWIFSMMKIFEGISISASVYINGNIR